MVADGRTRPLGLSPGAGALVGGWVVAGMIARLTGTPVVIALMAALLVTGVVEALAGWSTARRTRVVSIAGPPVTTVGSSAPLRVAVAGPDTRRSGRLRLSTSPHTESEVVTGVFRAGGTMLMDAEFRDPGIVTVLHATIESAGPFGLIWWRHRSEIAINEVHVAPVGDGALLAVTSSTARHEGAVATRRGNHRGDIDGVRAWRDGDAVGSIHWPSSLRVGELIVHDRVAVADEHWVVDLDGLIAGPVDGSTAGRLRCTLDEGLRRGHDIAVLVGGESFPVRGDDDAATWAAWTASAIARNTASPRIAWWRRPIRLRAHEPESTVGAPARWAAAAAALASLALLVGGLSRSAVLIATIAFGLVLGAVVSTWLGRRSGRRPVALQAAIVLTIVVALALIAAEAQSIDGLLAVLRGPMPDMLMLLVVLHGFEVVDRRTLRVHQAITFVVASYAAGLRIDDALGWWIAVWGVAFFTSLLLTGRLRTVRLRTGRLQREGRVGPIGVRSILRPAAWVGAAVIGTLALLSVIPIPDGPARLGLPALSPGGAPVASPGALASPDGSPAPTGGDVGDNRGSIGAAVGYPGFTESLDTSVRGDLGDEIVMRVRASEPAFWRGQTFSEFDGRVWRVSPDTGTRREGPTIDVPPTPGDQSAAGIPTEEMIQTYYVEAALPNVVFAAARPTQVIFDGTLWTRPDGALRSDVVLAPGSVYTVISERVAATAELLRAQGDLGEFYAQFRDAAGAEQLDPFLELPASITKRTIDLATDLRAGSTYDTILAYERWLGANTEYDLDAPVPADGDDAVDDFLFVSQRGFCEQIASTLTVMLRSQGVPARLATGYLSGERDRVSGVWKVRAGDAHAWVEVWFPQTGWQAFDPTASVPLAGEIDAGTVGGDLVGAALSSIASHRLELALLAIAALVTWALSGVVRQWRHRRRRGRWGLLQDRFAALPTPAPACADPTPTDRPVFPDPTPTDRFTNPQRAALVDAGDNGLAAAVATTLDRVAFDPAWVDDDEVYTRTRSAVATLERSAR
ncbi:MAG TPA: transglutaminaseTgpA domain-containing protein [Ilumatobacteraceae bacterium]|nr:transglutaminaseTgpA domain-containing protein [Ilumatobacteraceae bacterium]